MRRRCRIAAVALALLTCGASAVAETGEVAPGITIAKRRLDAPINEQPFFGFQTKTAAQIEADRRFIADVTANPGREAAFRGVIRAGGTALAVNDFALAARRFNQAYLLSPSAPEVYHGFAAVAAGRFRDAAFAEELFLIALRLKPGDPAIQADYARLLLIERRAAAAVPLLESVVRHPNALAMHFSNLGFAYAQTGRREQACEALRMAESKAPPLELRSDPGALRQIAGC
jgi:Flp pilus assembly protein TadD